MVAQRMVNLKSPRISRDSLQDIRAQLKERGFRDVLGRRLGDESEVVVDIRMPEGREEVWTRAGDAGRLSINLLADQNDEGILLMDTEFAQACDLRGALLVEGFPEREHEFVPGTYRAKLASLSINYAIADAESLESMLSQLSGDHEVSRTVDAFAVKAAVEKAFEEIDETNSARGFAMDYFKLFAEYCGKMWTAQLERVRSDPGIREFVSLIKEKG